MAKVKFLKIPRTVVINKIRNSHREFLTANEYLLPTLEIVHRGRMEALQKILSRIDKHREKDEFGVKFYVMSVEELEKEISYRSHHEKKAYEEGNEERALFLDGYVDALRGFLTQHYIRSLGMTEENEKTD